MPDQLRRPIWWRVILGLVLVFGEVHGHVIPARNLLKASNDAQQFGMNIAAVVIILVGCWLVYSGGKPLWRKTQ